MWSLGKGKTKIYKNGLGHMTKIVAMLIYSKNNLQNSPSEPEVLSLETWHGALGTQGLQSLYK